MSEREFLETSAKKRTADAVRAVEAQTAVEVVVAVRRRAARHLETCLAFGVGCALVGLAVMWFSPWIYDVRTMPLDTVLAFVLGTSLCAFLPGLCRALIPKRRLERAAGQAARRAFRALGIEKTRGRTGLFVYVALFERTVVLVPDSGIPTAAVTGPLAAIGGSLGQAVARRDFEGFLLEFARLGPACGAALPRRPDDENELCDDVA
jgi:putative membrane protein